MNSRDREIMNLRAKLSLQEQQMTVIFQQARQSAAANAHAETTVVAQQASQFQGLISEFQSELAMSQLKGEQYGGAAEKRNAARTASNLANSDHASTRSC